MLFLSFRFLDVCLSRFFLALAYLSFFSCYTVSVSLSVCLFTVLAHGRDVGLQRSHFFVRPWAPLAIYPGTAATDARCPRAHDAQHPKRGLAVALAYMIVQDQVQLFSIP